jgi:PAS domain S-box-containing protein
MSADRREFVNRQDALADFGEFAIRSDDLDAILNEGCRLIASALGADLAKIVEIEHEKNSGLVRAGVGWRPGIVREQRVSLSSNTSEAFAVGEGKPVITSDIATETRFDFPSFMHEHGVVALVNVPIFLPGGVAYGILEVDARKPSDFTDEDIGFLRTYAAVVGPVIDRLYKIADLERSNERFRLVVENARDFVIILSDPEDLVTAWFPGAEEVLGWSEQEVRGKPVATIFTDEDKQSDIPARETASAVANGKSPDLRWHVTKSGGRVFLDGQTIALRHSDGLLRGFLKIAQDLTERKRNEERQMVLLAELQHRVRNVLAMVSAVLNRSDVSVSAKDFRDRLSGRITAMARTQALLTRGAGLGVDLEGMIREELLAQGAAESQYTLTGPGITLPPKAAEVLTLAVHELATNATKYGALSQPSGRIEVQWSLEGQEEKTSLQFQWSEQGVDLVPGAPQRKGFGTELITGRVPYELGGTGKMTLEAGGLVCRLSFPLGAGESILQAGISPTQRM